MVYFVFNSFLRVDQTLNEFFILDFNFSEFFHSGCFSDLRMSILVI